MKAVFNSSPIIFLTKPQRCKKLLNFTSARSCYILQQIDEMKQIFTDSLIGTHSESEFALRPRKTTPSLDDAMS